MNRILKHIKYTILVTMVILLFYYTSIYYLALIIGG